MTMRNLYRLALAGGLGLLTYGVWTVHEGAGLIVGGAVLAGASFLALGVGGGR